MCLLWLTRYPQHPAGQELRRLVLLILKIKTRNDRIYWIRELNQWHERYKDYLNEKTYNSETERYWYTHKMLRRSYLTIKRALPNMFHYLLNPKIPRSTNGIEGYFSHLKNHLEIHRGLTVKNRINFIRWYIFLSNEKWVFKAIKHTGSNENRQSSADCLFYYRTCIYLIAGKLVSTRAYLLLGRWQNIKTNYWIIHQPFFGTLPKRANFSLNRMGSALNSGKVP